MPGRAGLFAASVLCGCRLQVARQEGAVRDFPTQWAAGLYGLRGCMGCGAVWAAGLSTQVPHTHAHARAHDCKNEGKQAPVVQTHTECPGFVSYRSRQSHKTHGHVPPARGAFLEGTSAQRSLYSIAPAPSPPLGHTLYVTKQAQVNGLGVPISSAETKATTNIQRQYAPRGQSEPCAVRGTWSAS